MGNLTLGAMIVLGLGAASPLASAGDRLFTYTYEPTTMPQGAVEFEQWVTARVGKSSGDYARFDLRWEVEFGLLDDLQTALYLNTSSVRSKGVPEGNTFSDEEEVEFKGISNEWIMKFLDPVADPVGIAAYLEWGAGPEEIELEEKLLIGKVVGKWNFALNLALEQEWEFERKGLTNAPAPPGPDGGDRKVERELVFELDAGVSYLVGNFAVGLEFRNHNEYEDMTKFEHSAFFLGPVVHFRQDRWWATMTILPQIGAIKPTDHGLVLDEHERVEVRLLLGLDF